MESNSQGPRQETSNMEASSSPTSRTELEELPESAGGPLERPSCCRICSRSSATICFSPAPASKASAGSTYGENVSA
eukprot:scaffold2322_cov15-Tisochrysis_lutea.AAC.1